MSNTKQRDSLLIKHYLDCFFTLRKLISAGYLRLDIGLPRMWIANELYDLMFFDGLDFDERKALSFLEVVRTYINFLRRGREYPLEVIADDMEIDFAVCDGKDVTYIGWWRRDKVMVRNYERED